MDYFVHTFGDPGKRATTLTCTNSADRILGAADHTWQKSLIVSILSAGTFFGSLIAGSVADWIGRRSTVIAGCVIFSLGVILQVASSSIGVLIPGRLVAGFGVGFVSAVIILYMSEVAPKAVRGAIVSGYQFFITIGLMLASVVNQGTHSINNSGAYRIPMSLQLLWALILGTGLFLLPESPRYYVKKNRLDDAAISLSKLRGHPIDSPYIKDELAELVANYRFESEHMQSSWLDCFRGGWAPSGNFRRVFLGIALQMMQQWTGVNFSKFSCPRHLTIANSDSLLLRHYLLPAGRHPEQFSHRHDHDRCQRGLYANLLLDY